MNGVQNNFEGKICSEIKLLLVQINTMCREAIKIKVVNGKSELQIQNNVDMKFSQFLILIASFSI